MELLLKVDGMMCVGCENRVKTALNNMENVIEVIASHENGTVIVKLAVEMDKKIFVEAIEDLGFDVKED